MADKGDRLRLVDTGKRSDQMLDELERLYRTRRSTIRVCLAYKAAFPELAEQMEWILTVGLEATEKEMHRA